MKVKKQYSVAEMEGCLDIFLSTENNISEYEIVNIILNCSATSLKFDKIVILLQNNFDLFSDKQFLLNTMKNHFARFNNKTEASWYHFIYEAGFSETQIQDAEIFLLNNCYLGAATWLKKIIAYCGIEKVNYYVDYWLNKFFSDMSLIYYSVTLLNSISQYNILEEQKIAIKEKELCQKHNQFILEYVSSGKMYTQYNNLVFLILEYGTNENKKECYNSLIKMFCKDNKIFNFINDYKIPFSSFIDGMVRNYTNSDMGLNEKTKQELDAYEVAVKLIS